MNKVSILSVDDSRAIHAFLTSCLPDYKLIHVYNGLEGVNFLTHTQEKIDLVLLDWEMPVMDGPKALVEIKKMKPQLPVIMLTSKNDPKDIELILSNGASEYVLKPFTQEIINEKIKMVIGS